MTNAMPGAGETPRYRTLVCLVSEQATPNVTPLLERNWAPRRVVLVVTPQMRERADWLAEFVRPRGMAVERLEVADPNDLDAMLTAMCGWLDGQPGDEPIALNATGGTKPMAMAAQQAFMLANRDVLYVPGSGDEVQWLGARHKPMPLTGRLSLQEFCAVHGFQVTDRTDYSAPPAARRGLTNDLVLNAASFQHALGALNGYAARARQECSSVVQLDDRRGDDPHLHALVQKFEAAGQCRLEGRQLRFTDEAARAYCNGGWLEEHVAQVVNDVGRARGVTDLALNLKVRARGNRLSRDHGANELDVAFLAGHRLHVVECKTRSYGEQGSAADALYKLAAVGRVGGLQARRMLVTYRNLPEGDRQRAEDLGILVVGPAELRRLQDTLPDWLSGAVRGGGR